MEKKNFATEKNGVRNARKAMKMLEKMATKTRKIQKHAPRETHRTRKLMQKTTKTHTKKRVF